MNIEIENDWLSAPAAHANEAMAATARQRQCQLTKPPGSLGRLETEVIRLAGMQARELPRLDQVHIAVFAGDHGIAAAGVSAFPQAVTAEMVKNFARGGAAISVLAQELGAHLDVVNLGTVVPADLGRDENCVADVQTLALGEGTADFRYQAAMTEQQLMAALEAGRQNAEGAYRSGADIFLGGEMGIGNTTSAAALACALLQRPAVDLVGPGTGLDASGVRNKADVVDQALDRHAAALSDPLASLRCVGGFEIAALTGAYLACAQRGVAVLIDGFICTTAALCAARICPGALDWMIFGHGSAEPGHRILLDALGAEPLLNLDMRLGEASGAAIAIPVLRTACALHQQMATFAEAGIPGGA